MSKPVFNLISEQLEDNTDNKIHNKLEIGNTVPPIQLSQPIYSYSSSNITDDIVNNNLDELYNIFEKNLILLDEEYIKEVLNPSIFNGFNNIDQIQYKLSLINFNCVFIGYIIGNKLDLISIEDENFILLVAQYMKVVIHDIISDNFNINSFYKMIQNLYNIYSHTIDGNTISIQSKQQKQTIESINTQHFDLSNPVLNKDIRLTIIESIRNLINEEIVNYSDQIKDMTSQLNSIRGTIDETKPQKTNKK